MLFPKKVEPAMSRRKAIDVCAQKLGQNSEKRGPFSCRRVKKLVFVGMVHWSISLGAHAKRRLSNGWKVKMRGLAP